MHAETKVHVEITFTNHFMSISCENGTKSFVQKFTHTFARQ